MHSYLKIKPQYFFVIAALYFFWQLNIVTPPLQAPDEFTHFYRTIQIADGQLATKVNNKRLGGYVPGSVREFVLPYSNAATNIKYTLSKQELYHSFNIPFTSSDSVFLDFPNTALHSPVSYAPQALAVFVLKKLNYSLGEIYYGARYFMFCCWLVAMFYVIKMMPYAKWLITFLILLPMNLYVTNSFSADTVTNILALLFISYVLKISQQQKWLSYKQVVLLLVLIALLAMAKFVYVGLVLMLFVIPLQNFKSKKHYAITIGSLFFVAFLVTYSWSEIVMANYLPYADYNPAFRNFICLSNCANYYQQKALILSDWSYFAKVIYRSLFDHPITYLNGYIGIFGNSDVFLKKDIIYLAYFSIALVAVTETNSAVLKWQQKVILLLAAFVAFVLLLLSQHLTWDCVGEGIVDLIQGRYLIPILPALFLVLGNTFFKFKFLPMVVVATTLLYLYNYSSKQIYNRFFVDTFYKQGGFYCGAEKINEWNYFLTSQKAIEIDGKHSQTNSVAHTGKYSVKLSKENQYSMVYVFEDLECGDLLEINAWQKGVGAQFVLAGNGKNCEEFYYASNQVHYLNSKGWGKMQMVKTIGLKCDSVKATFYVWNPDTTKTVFVDDLQFSIKKFKNKYYMDSLFIK